MSRMRLMDAGTGAGRLVCLYCGAEAESRPPYAVMYCDCRSVAASLPTRAHGAPGVARAA